MPYESTWSSPFNNVLILSNPLAGKGRAGKVASLIGDRLSRLGIRYDLRMQWPGTVAGYSSIFLVGGDGTLNFFINRYQNIDVPIALFKGGSGNDFAWQLYGNISIDKYLERVLKQQILEVDAGRCNDRLFLNGFGIGFDGAIVKSMGKKKKFSAGHIAYLYTVLRNIVFYKEFPATIMIDNQPSRMELPFLLAVANDSRYGGGFWISPESIINDGKLNLVLIKKIAPLKRIFKVPLVQKGRHLSLEMVEHCYLDQISIETPILAWAHCDGELIEGSKFNIKVLPARYKFFV